MDVGMASEDNIARIIRRAYYHRIVAFLAHAPSLWPENARSVFQISSVIAVAVGIDQKRYSRRPFASASHLSACCP